MPAWVANAPNASPNGATAANDNARASSARRGGSTTRDITGDRVPGTRGTSR